MNKQNMRYIFLIGLLPVASAFAETAVQCHNLKDDALRLACYDRIFAVRFLDMPGKSGQHEAKPVLNLTETVRSSLDKKEAVIVVDEDVPSGDQAGATEATYTPLSLMYDLDRNDTRGLLSVREHNPMYLMPFWYNSSPNYSPSSPTRGITEQERFGQQKRAETKLQISFKSKITEDLFKSRADLWFGYTQKSDWQIFNQGRKSAPFRNTDYKPEIFLTQPVKADLPWGGRLRMLGTGFVHQSNGQSRPESRSWNRIYAVAGMEWGKLTVVPRVWMRVFDQGGDKNDNPDIADYMGYGDVKVQYRLNDRKNVYSVLRYNPKTGYGAVEAAYTFPITGKLKGVVRGFHGYGESLIDYNRKQSGIGFGLMFNDWDGI